MHIKWLSMPPPTYHPYGFHFIGKRVSSQFLDVGSIPETNKFIEIQLVDNKFLIKKTDRSTKGIFRVFDLRGSLVKQIAISEDETSIYFDSKDKIFIFHFTTTHGEVQCGKVMAK
jgi:hypothetical protein